MSRIKSAWKLMKLNLMEKLEGSKTLEHRRAE